MSTVQVVLTQNQLKSVISAMYSQKMESERYRGNTVVSDTPQDTDTCCEWHLMRWKNNRQTHLSMQARVQHEQDIISMLESLEER